MPLIDFPTEPITEALRAWLMDATGFADSQVIHSYDNGPAGAGARLSYITLGPLTNMHRQGMQPRRVRSSGKLYQIENWIAEIELSAYRNDPGGVLAACERGLFTDASLSYREYFSLQRITNIAASPRERGQNWEPAANMTLRIGFRLAHLLDANYQQVNQVGLRFVVNTKLENITTIKKEP